jgi:hypothetical protein
VDNHEKYAYSSFRKQPNNSLKKIINNEEMPFKWKSSGFINKTTIFPRIANYEFFDYDSCVFIPLIRRMIVVIKEMSTDDAIAKYQVKYRDLQMTGDWAEWTDKYKIGFKGLFLINQTLFAISPEGDRIFEFTNLNDLGFVDKVNTY